MSSDKLSTKKFRYSPLTRYGRFLIRKINKAFKEFDLISPGDNVCVSVSGGKDSLSLLHLLLEHKRFYPSDFTVSAVHVVSDHNPEAGRLRDYLEAMFERLNIGYGFVEMEITKDIEGNDAEPSCFWCAWKRRETVFRYCVENGMNKLAFGHHADDVAETTLLNLVFHGTLDTILPKRTFFGGAFDVIRPLFYIREKELVRYAEMAGFETTSCSCPNEDLGKRRVMKRLVRDLTKESRQLHANFWRAARIWHETIGDRKLHTTPREEPPEQPEAESW